MSQCRTLFLKNACSSSSSSAAAALALPLAKLQLSQGNSN
jgi:hypothetical protein